MAQAIETGASSAGRERQPRQLYILSLAQLLKFFSHYGNRALLVLFMINMMDMSDKHAFGIYAVYGGLVELGAAFGGILADRYLGRRRAVIIGSLVIAFGHILMSFGVSFYFGLGAIAVGCLLFTTNIITLLSEYYDGDELSREKGFTIFYVLMNVGALLATLLCSYLSTHLGYHKGFGLAAIGMLFCCTLLFVYQKELKEKPKKINVKGGIILLATLPLMLVASGYLIAYEQYSLPVLPAITLAIFCYFGYTLRHDKRRLYYLAGLILFLLFEEQICTSILLYSERNATSFLASGFLLSVNPIVIMIAGPLIYPLARLVAKVRVPAVFGFLALTFGLFSMLLLLNIRVPYFGVALLVVAITIGELVLTPFVYSLFSERGAVMGIIPVGSALAAQLGGYISKMLAIQDGSITAYGAGFGKVTIILAAITLLALLFHKPLFMRYEKSLQEGIAQH